MLGRQVEGITALSYKDSKEKEEHLRCWWNFPSVAAVRGIIKAMKHRFPLLKERGERLAVSISVSEKRLTDIEPLRYSRHVMSIKGLNVKRRNPERRICRQWRRRKAG